MLALGLSRDRYEKSEMYKMGCGDLTGPALFWEGPHLWFLLLEYSCLSWLRRAGWKEDGLKHPDNLNVDWSPTLGTPRLPTERLFRGQVLQVAVISTLGKLRQNCHEF